MKKQLDLFGFLLKNQEQYLSSQVYQDQVIDGILELVNKGLDMQTDKKKLTKCIRKANMNGTVEIGFIFEQEVEQ